MKKLHICYVVLSGFLCMALLCGCASQKSGEATKTPDSKLSSSKKEMNQNSQKKSLAVKTDENKKTIDKNNKLDETQPAIPLENLSNKTYGWGLVKVKGAPPRADQKMSALLAQYNGFYIDAKPSKKALYLTFDEGYENGNTAKILDVLKAKKAPATFFITGPYIKTESELVLRMLKEGHIVGNHTIHHPSMPSVTDNTVLQKELLDLDEEFYDLTGKNMKYVRPPRGEFSERTLALTKNLGYRTVLWSFAYKDWITDAQQGTNYAFNAIIPFLHSGEILLLHAASSDNAGALSQVIDYARSQGYEFYSLDSIK